MTTRDFKKACKIVEAVNCRKVDGHYKHNGKYAAIVNTLLGFKIFWVYR